MAPIHSRAHPMMPLLMRHPIPPLAPHPRVNTPPAHWTRCYSDTAVGTGALQLRSRRTTIATNSLLALPRTDNVHRWRALAPPARREAEGPDRAMVLAQQVRLLLRSNRLSNALFVLRRARQQRIPVDIDTYAYALQCILASGRLAVAHRFYLYLASPASGCVPDERIFRRLVMFTQRPWKDEHRNWRIRTLPDTHAVRRARRRVAVYYADMLRFRASTVKLHTSMLDWFFRVEDANAARLCWRDMCAIHGDAVDPPAHLIRVLGFAQKGACFSPAETHEALADLLDCIRTQGDGAALIRLEVPLTSAVACLARAGDAHIAVQVLHDALAYIRKLNADRSLSLVTGMDPSATAVAAASEPTLDLQAHTAMITAHGRARDAHRAEDWWRRLHDSGARPDLVAWHARMIASLRAGRPAAVVGIYDAMQGRLLPVSATAATTSASTLPSSTFLAQPAQRLRPPSHADPSASTPVFNALLAALDRARLGPFAPRSAAFARAPATSTLSLPLPPPPPLPHPPSAPPSATRGRKSPPLPPPSPAAASRRVQAVLHATAARGVRPDPATFLAAMRAADSAHDPRDSLAAFWDLAAFCRASATSTATTTETSSASVPPTPMVPANEAYVRALEATASLARRSASVGPSPLSPSPPPLTSPPLLRSPAAAAIAAAAAPHPAWPWLQVVGAVVDVMQEFGVRSAPSPATWAALLRAVAAAATGGAERRVVEVWAAIGGADAFTCAPPAPTLDTAGSPLLSGWRPLRGDRWAARAVNSALRSLLAACWDAARAADAAGRRDIAEWWLDVAGDALAAASGGLGTARLRALLAAGPPQTDTDTAAATTICAALTRPDHALTGPVSLRTASPDASADTTAYAD
ncbi:hypothetical protein HK405_009332, partial [Cladochytrium tenue]